MEARSEVKEQGVGKVMGEELKEIVTKGMQQ